MLRIFTDCPSSLRLALIAFLGQLLARGVARESGGQTQPPAILDNEIAAALKKLGPGLNVYNGCRGDPICGRPQATMANRQMIPKHICRVDLPKIGPKRNTVRAIDRSSPERLGRFLSIDFLHEAISYAGA